MGVSFKVAKVGTRYKPKLVQIDDKGTENASSNDAHQRSAEIGAEIVDDSNKKVKNGLHSKLEELEVSFSLNLFKDGFSIGKAIEFLNDIPKQLHPYDKASEALFSAIECGWLPGEILDDIPCKYVNGALMCEIRDYRNIFPCKEGHISPTGNVPIVHKIILQLCMESVVKDILSISDGSWTYKDLLEIESCIIKALQPDLHLNPEPLWDKFCGEPPRKKLDLGIEWSWKKRKFSDVPTHSLPMGDPNFGNHTMVNYLIQKSKPQSVPAEENISQCFGNPQGINNALGSTSPSHAMVVLKTPMVVSAPNQLFTNVNTVTPGNPIVPTEKGICDKQAMKRLPSKKVKEEPVDLPKLQHLGSEVNIAPGSPEIQWMDNALQQQIKVDKVPYEKEKSKLHFPQIRHDDQMALKGIQNLLTRVPSVKKEPAETSGLHADYLCRDSRIDQFNLHNSNKQLSSKPLRVKSYSIHTCNHMAQPSDKDLKTGTASQKRKNSQNCQVIAAVGSLSVTSQNSSSLQRQAPISTGQKNSRSKWLKTEMVDSIVSMRSTNVTNANSPTAKNLPLPLPQPSVEVNNAIERLLKVMKTTKRYGLINRKRKLEQFVGKKPFFRLAPPLVGFHLASLEDHGKSEYSTGYKISASNYTNGQKTRTLIFSHESHIIQRSDSPMVNREPQIKLIMLHNFDLGTLQARVFYGCEGGNSISSHLLPTFHSTHSAAQFERQFTSLLDREGYRLISDQVVSSPCNKDDETSIERPIVSDAILTSGTFKPFSSTWTAGLSPPIHNSLNIRMPFHDPTKLPLPNIPSGVNFTTGGKSHSSPQLAPSFSSNPQVDNLQQQMRSMQQWWQQSANKFSWLQFQMQLLRHQQEQELLPRTESLVDPRAVASGHNAVLLNDSVQRIRNIGSGSRSNMMGNTGSAPIVSGGLVHWLNSLSTCNNLENHISGLNDKQHFSSLSDHRFPALPKPSTSQDPGRGLKSRLPTQRSPSMLAIAKPDALAMRYMSNNHLEPRAETSQQSHMLQQQEIRPMLQPRKVASFADLAGSSMHM